MTINTTSQPDTAQARLNPLSLVSILCAVGALAGTVGFGLAVLAVFGVGAGHMALQQIKPRGERGAALAYISLAICYLIAVWALVNSITLLFGLTN